MNTLGAHSEFMVKEFLFRANLSKADTEQVTLVVIPPVPTPAAPAEPMVTAARSASERTTGTRREPSRLGGPS